MQYVPVVSKSPTAVANLYIAGCDLLYYMYEYYMYESAFNIGCCDTRSQVHTVCS